MNKLLFLTIFALAQKWSLCDPLPFSDLTNSFSLGTQNELSSLIPANLTGFTAEFGFHGSLVARQLQCVDPGYVGYFSCSGYYRRLTTFSSLAHREMAVAQRGIPVSQMGVVVLALSRAVAHTAMIRPSQHAAPTGLPASLATSASKGGVVLRRKSPVGLLNVTTRARAYAARLGAVCMDVLNLINAVAMASATTRIRKSAAMEDHVRIPIAAAITNVVGRSLSAVVMGSVRLAQQRPGQV